MKIHINEYSVCVGHGSKHFSHGIGIIVLSILPRKKMRHRNNTSQS